jgi:hypothetical protein
VPQKVAQAIHHMSLIIDIEMDADEMRYYLDQDPDVLSSSTAKLCKSWAPGDHVFCVKLEVQLDLLRLVTSRDSDSENQRIPNSVQVSIY